MGEHDAENGEHEGLVAAAAAEFTVVLQRLVDELDAAERPGAVGEPVDRDVALADVATAARIRDTARAAFAEALDAVCEERIDAAITTARQACPAGATWAQLGTALGITGQAVGQRAGQRGLSRARAGEDPEVIAARAAGREQFVEHARQSRAASEAAADAWVAAALRRLDVQRAQHAPGPPAPAGLSGAAHGSAGGPHGADPVRRPFPLSRPAGWPPAGELEDVTPDGAALFRPPESRRPRKPGKGKKRRR